MWDIELKECVKKWDCVPKGNNFFTTPVLARASWQPNGKHYLAVPHNKEIEIYERSTWSHITSLTSSSCTEVLSPLCFTLVLALPKLLLK